MNTLEKGERSQNDTLIINSTLNNKYIVFTESEIDDKRFWEIVLKTINSEFESKCKIAVLNMENDIQNGVSYIRKFIKETRLDFKTQNVLFCIDSDANYILRDELTQNKEYLIQTYTHSIENHKTKPQILNELSNYLEFSFDFTSFLERYSDLMYSFFIYWIAENRIGKLSSTSKNKFPQISIKITKEELKNNGELLLKHLEKQIVTWYKNNKNKLELINSEETKKYIEEFGIDSKHTSYYLRGHNLNDIIKAIIKAIIDLKFTEIKTSNISDELKSHQRIKLSSYENQIEILLRDSISKNDCKFMNRIKLDVENFIQSKSF